MQTGLIDYGAGNLHSVDNTLKSLGVNPRLVTRPGQLDGITHLVLPGVGSFGDCSRKLRQQGLFQAIADWIQADRPFFGICVGLQILMDSSEESPGEPGLGIFTGPCKRFEAAHLKVPHMGWNPLLIRHPDQAIWAGLPASPHLYFVHSYFAVPDDSQVIAAECDYGGKFCAAIQQGRLFASQFHPEKSQKLGSMVLRNFLQLPE